MFAKTKQYFLNQILGVAKNINKKKCIKQKCRHSKKYPLTQEMAVRIGCRLFNYLSEYCRFFLIQSIQTRKIF